MQAIFEKNVGARLAISPSITGQTSTKVRLSSASQSAAISALADLHRVGHAPAGDARLDGK